MTAWDEYQRSLLALVIWREARGEGPAGMLAVACTIRNRVDRASWWGKSFAEVIGKKLQYSSMAAPGDPQLLRWPRSESDEGFNTALVIAEIVMRRGAESPVPGADSYYDISIPAPEWATPETYVGALGRLRFHNLDHDVELPAIENKVWP